MLSKALFTVLIAGAVITGASELGALTSRSLEKVDCALAGEKICVIDGAAR